MCDGVMTFQIRQVLTDLCKKVNLPETGVIGTLSSLKPILPYSFLTSMHKSKQ